MAHTHACSPQTLRHSSPCSFDGAAGDRLACGLTNGRVLVFHKHQRGILDMDMVLSVEGRIDYGAVRCIAWSPAKQCRLLFFYPTL